MTTPKYDLPTAIRIGAKMYSQCWTMYHDHHGGSCVLGAAGDGEGLPYTNSIYLKELWPELDQDMGDELDLFCAITFLNDKAHWTREEIADWLDMILP